MKIVAMCLGLVVSLGSVAHADNFSKKKKIRELRQKKPKPYWENSRLYRVVDLDGDGDRDIVYITEVQGKSDSRARIKWLENKNKGKKWKDHELHDDPVRYNQLIVIDLDGDNDLDVLTQSTRGRAAWWENKGKARKFERHDFHDDVPRGRFDAGDVDGDGDNDIVIIASPETLWLENDGKENFSKPIELEGARTYDRRQLAVVDIDGDKKAEVIINGPTLSLHELDGGKWKTTDLGKDNSGGLLHVVDIDNDGDLDLLTGNKGLAVMRNDKGSFKREQIKAVRYSPQDIVVADFDGDKDNDIAFNVGAGNGVRVSMNIGKKGALDFAKPYKVAMEKEHTPWTPTDLHAGDIDGDGDIDLVLNSLGVSHTAFAAWWENKGRKKGKMARTR